MVSYLGPSGSFTQEAAIKRFGARARLEAGTTIGEVFESVEAGRAQSGVVPIYNSTGGFVNDTLDELLRVEFSRSGCQIAEQLEMDIHLCLMGRGTAGRIRRIYTHPIPLKHSRGWVKRAYPQAELIPATSTSEAAKRVSKERDSAAIGSKAAASLYGLHVLDVVKGINKRNRTQFITFGRHALGRITNARTAIGFGLAHRPGTLAAVLTELANHKVNLTRIVSRPLPGKAGEYVFLVDFEGDRRSQHVQDALDRVRKSTMFLRVLGTYQVVPRFRS
ncbi:MAG: ACT domain-containing protein [Verrucomicrobiae bacterium]|nr:ACT domain-containing protein [Verrucomicrobiae bacterium]